MANEANADQSDFWNGDPGRTWLAEIQRLDRMHAPVVDRLLAVAAPQPGEVIFDIGCGTGPTSRVLAQAVGPTGRVIGLDISTPLIEAARAEAPPPQLEFLLADAQTYAFPPADADAMASRFGVMFFDDPQAAFVNMAGGLKPGGRLAFIAWDGPSENPWFGLQRRVLEKILGPGESPAPYAPGPLAFGDRDRVAGLLAAAGLSDVETWSEPLTLGSPGTLDSFLPLITQLGPVASARRQRGIGDKEMDRIIDRIAQDFARFADADGQIVLPASINVFTARRA